MAQYKTGSVNTTAGSNIVTGLGTAWLANVAPGDLLLVGSPAIPFTVAAVGSDTQLTLSANFTTTHSDEDYVVIRDFTPGLGLPKVNQGDLHAAEIITRAFTLLDQAFTNNYMANLPSTDDLDEGATNLYFTTDRARASLSASGYLSYDDATGAFGFNAAGFATSLASSFVRLDGSNTASLLKVDDLKLNDRMLCAETGNLDLRAGTTNLDDTRYVNILNGRLNLYSDQGYTTGICFGGDQGYTPYNAITFDDKGSPDSGFTYNANGGWHKFVFSSISGYGYLQAKTTAGTTKLMVTPTAVLVNTATSFGGYDFQVDGSAFFAEEVRAYSFQPTSGYKSVDGSTGMTGTRTFQDYNSGYTHEVVIKNGLIIGWAVEV